MTAQIHHLSEHIPDDDLILVPDGDYELAYQYHQTWLFQGRIPKLSVLFRIMDMGSHYEKPIWGHYNLSRINGKPKKNGVFTVGWRSRFIWDYAMCFGKPPRKDRISMTPFEKQFVNGSTRTVTHNQKQKQYPDGLQYSVLDELKGVLTL